MPADNIIVPHTQIKSSWQVSIRFIQFIINR